MDELGATTDLLPEGGLDLLVVDDDEDDAFLLEELLGEMSDAVWRLTWVTGVEAGLEAMASQRFGVCLVDYRLGADNGLAFIERAKAVDETVPIILLTGENRREVDVAAMRAGAVDFVAKDRLDAQTLDRALRYALERRRSEAELIRLALRDPLTALHNRASMDHRLTGAFARAADSGRPFAVVVCDLDGFKAVNDGFGHEVGDELLRVIGRRLKRAVRPYDTVGRVGGDEFVVLLENLGDPREAVTIGERLCAVVRPPFEISAPRAQVSASIGVAFHPGAGADEASLMKAADAAMYEAKQRGKAQVVVDWGERKVTTLPTTPEAVREAIGLGRFHVVYHPIMDLATHRPVGLQALSRWSGEASIAELVQRLETSEAIAELDLWVMDKAVTRLETTPWATRASMNLSPVTLQVEGSLDRIAALVARAPGRLEVEMTPRAGIEDMESFANQLHVLRTLGLRVALDNFGSEGSSFERLLRLPLDTVRVDRSLVAEMASNARCRLFVGCLVDFGRKAGLDVVVEGVETQDQEEHLRALGVDRAQGYRFGAPVREEELEAWSDGRVA